MDYYDFFCGEKQVISQSAANRLLLIKYKKDIIIIDEYTLDGVWYEQSRMRLTEEQISKLSEMI